MAAVHAGILTISCSDCQDAPWFRESQGCEEPTQTPVWEDGDDNEYYNCPIRWLTSDIAEWYQQYSYDIEFHCGLTYDQQSIRYTEAWQIYKQHLNRFQREQAEKGKQDKTADGLESLQAGFKARQ